MEVVVLGVVLVDAVVLAADAPLDDKPGVGPAVTIH